MKLIHRIIFLVVFLDLLVIWYTLLFLEKESFNTFSASDFSTFIFFIYFFSCIFYVYIFVFSIFDLIRYWKKRKLNFIWFLSFMFIPFFSQLLYAEKYLYNNYFVVKNKVGMYFC